MLNSPALRVQQPSGVRRFGALIAFTSVLFGVQSVCAEEMKPDEKAKQQSFGAKFWDSLIGGKPILDVTLRWENGKADTLQTSNSATARTRLGYQTKPLYGVSGLLEFENIASPYEDGYFDAVEANDRRQTPVADPEVTAANRFWLNLEREDWLGLKLKTGRQRIKLDDDRWVGNVGWRQNEQTFDGVRFQSNFGLEKLVAQYVYAWEVNRIFGDQGPANRRDFGITSHFLNIAYTFAQQLKAVGFVYSIDANDPFAGNSSNTYGTRLTGLIPLTESLGIKYEGSYAYQQNAYDNPVDYDAHYYLADAGIKVKSVGLIGAGYEVLGTDNGKARIVTPFSTAHKFNGFADVFLNNGGVRGLRDVYAYLAPDLSMISKKLKFKFIFHQFYDDQGGDNLGVEYDLVSTYKVNKYWSFLYKFGYFDGGKNRSPLSTVRSILQTTIKF